MWAHPTCSSAPCPRAQRRAGGSARPCLQRPGGDDEVGVRVSHFPARLFTLGSGYIQTTAAVRPESPQALADGWFRLPACQYRKRAGLRMKAQPAFALCHVFITRAWVVWGT